MAKLNQMKHISVLNYNENYVCISVAPNKSIRLEPADGNTPSLTPLTLDEIRYANNGNVFKTGIYYAKKLITALLMVLTLNIDCLTISIFLSKVLNLKVCY